ncbi:MAG: penicillin-binding protein 1C [Gammaproteobacteria bacterium]|nr:penicillin-binding protein 1C [Gammaproteobacteria bacterium]
MKRRFGSLVAVLITLVLGLVVLRYWPRPGFAEGQPGSHLVLAADGSLLRMTLAADGQYRVWVPLNAVAPSLVEAILLKEDQYFYWHPGINPVALVRAAAETYGGGTRQGASTLSMQLARRWYGLNTRSIPGKLEQLVLALWLEARYGKDAILEAYLNLAPMGGNVEGVEAGSRIYFNKPASKLSLAESLALAVLPQKPSARGDFGEDLQAARRLLAAQWQAAHVDDEVRLALAELPVSARSRRHLPFRAPHLVEQLLAAEPARQRFDTTLDPALQNLLERQIRRYIGERGQLGVVNATAILVDSRDMAVKALVGSANYFDAAIAGQVNGVLAKRSPGSTLKPFLYGLAIDQGLIHPMSVLKDAPTAFGPFQPENFDGRFAGPVAARDALVRSRNVPAVWLATQVREPSLHGFLHSAGVSHLKSETHYGLALALGGGELSMEELATLYALLANEGRLKSLRYRQDQKSAEGPRLLSPEAAFLVLDMLKDNPRPDGLPAGARSWTTAWKTGTSWGFRDAWTAGVVGHYVLVVWAGNFDGHGNPALVGIDTAAPLFFRIADALPLNLARTPDRLLQPPRGLQHVEVCAASGELPNAWCPQTVSSWFIPGKSPIKVSSLHRPVLIDMRTGKAACPPIDPAHTRQEVFEFWSSDMQKLFREAGMPRRSPPDPARDCGLAGSSTGEAPRLLSPLNQVVYTLRLSHPLESIALQATAGAEVKKLYWFADKQYLGTSARDAGLAWRPEKSGRFSVLAVDDLGRGASRELRVEFMP